MDKRLLIGVLILTLFVSGCAQSPAETPTPKPTPPMRTAETTPSAAESTIEEETQQKSPAVSRISSVQFTDSPLPMYKGNPRHTSLSAYDTSHVKPIEKWRFSVRGGIITPPAIDKDGTIYFGSWDKNVYAIGGHD